MTKSTMSNESERLQKYLARAGVASRRGAEEIITAGRVAVNGIVVRELGVKVTSGVDVVTVDGRLVVPTAVHEYLMLNKPDGVVTTLDDPQGRPTVASFLPQDAPRMFPVGRLDQNTTGLLLLTNDGELANQLMHPRFHVPKTYVAEVDGMPDDEDVRRLREGVDLDDGRTLPAEAELVSVLEHTSIVRLVLREGRKRQVRRMLSAVGHPVLTLRRVAYGPVQIGDLVEGAVRRLTTAEVDALRGASGGEA
jgi:23S rRNA pseudouridine2605 synthase